MTHLAFELRTNTPDALTAELAERWTPLSRRSSRYGRIWSGPRNSRRAW
jgi:hypothetical protein